MEDSLAELRKLPSPFDHWIFVHGKRYFPKWDRDSQLRWLNELLPLTDAGSTTALMEVAEENDLILAWDQYALQLPAGKERERLRQNALGPSISQKYWQHTLEVTGDGTHVLRLKDTRSGAECAFRAKCGPVPKEGKLFVCPMNSDLAVEYRFERTVRDGMGTYNISDCKILFEVRRDAETNQWFETGSWDEIRRRKTPAVTTYEEIRNVPVCTEIVDGKSVFRTFRLTAESRRFKLGKIEPRDIVSSPPEDNAFAVTGE